MKKDEILERLDNFESLLKKQDDHAYRQADKPINFKEACAYLGYAPSYMYKLTSTGKIPHHKPSGKILFFSKIELDEWIFGKYGERETEKR